MSRRHRTLRDQLLHQWRRVRRNELSRTLRHMKVQEQRREKRAIYVRNYVMKSIDSIDRVEGRGNAVEQDFLPMQD
ncbi:hypothetical protein [Prochlorococcus sp. MIT 1307]|uniref:hypothetical protein n=1 Tax=Prochlorococcus sp. MIT 1307 TaxID=3096219 RepID=UPI002A747A32|nr:hypothetical protein [Prochlorococcus sp. MIT 1307]